MKKILKLLATSILTLPTLINLNNQATISNIKMLTNLTAGKNSSDVVINAYDKNMNPNEIQHAKAINVQDILLKNHYQSLNNNLVLLANNKQNIINNDDTLQLNDKTIGKSFTYYVKNPNTNQINKLIINDNRKISHFAGLSEEQEYHELHNSEVSFSGYFNEKVMGAIKKYQNLPIDALMINTNATFRTYHEIGNPAREAVQKLTAHTYDTKNPLWKVFEGTYYHGSIIDIHFDITWYFLSGNVVHYNIRYDNKEGKREVDWIENYKYSVTEWIGAGWSVKIDPFSYYSVI